MFRRTSPHHPLFRRLRSGGDPSAIELLDALPSWRFVSVVSGPTLGMIAYALGGALEEPARVMLGIFTLTAVYWTLGTVPPFATAILCMTLMAFLLGIPAGAGVDAGGVTSWTDFIEPAAAPVIVLMLGGFVMGRTVHLVGVDRVLAGALIKPFARTPALTVLGVMLVTALLSMWMSNTATAAMMLAIVAPIAGQFPAGANERKSLLVAIAVGANVGGMGTPIGTPPNAIAFAALKGAGVDVTFLDWLVVGIPGVALVLVLAWAALCRLYPWSSTGVEIAFPAREGRTDWRVWTVGTTFVVTVGLWVTGAWTGLPVAAVAILPLMVFTVTGLLTRRELNSLEWDILLLIAGGLALGQGMTLTGLADWMVAQLPLGGLGAVATVAILGGATLTLSTFMSNTAVANMLIAIGIGLAAVPDAGASLAQIGITIALCASLAMGLPVSTPPNAIVFAGGQEPGPDGGQVPGVRTTDFLRVGAIVGLLGLLYAIVASAVVVPGLVG
ncbi:MAG: DASS family sodium-coupled anion symporter [Planctomycetota bacterium]